MFSNWQSSSWTNSPDYVRKVWPFILLDLVLKAFALWRSARRGEKWWFVALIVINSLGILPGIYLLTHREEKKETKKKK